MNFGSYNRLQRFRQHRQPFMNMGVAARQNPLYGLEEISNLSLLLRDAVGCRLAGVYDLVVTIRVSRSLINNG